MTKHETPSIPPDKPYNIGFRVTPFKEFRLWLKSAVEAHLEHPARSWEVRKASE